MLGKVVLLTGGSHGDDIGIGNNYGYSRILGKLLFCVPGDYRIKVIKIDKM